MSNTINEDKFKVKNKIKYDKVENGIRYIKNGFIFIHIEGKPRERGYAYGYLCAKEFKEIQMMLKYYMFESYGEEWSYFIEEINKSIKELTINDFHEFYEEMLGISEGCIAGGTQTTVDEIIAWNFYCSIPYWFSFRSQEQFGKEGGGFNLNMLGNLGNMGNRIGDKCSAFVAVGDWTKDGKIVMAHNSFCDYIDGQYSNVVLDINPDKGFRIMMQTSPCWIWSGTDFFVTSAGIMGTETTIGGFQPYENKIPVAYRIRRAMQYGISLDDYVFSLLNGNSGDYANSWIFGDIKTNEILRIELGLKYNSISRTKNGFFIGFNAPYDPRIRNIEVHNSGFYDIRRHQGARRVRIMELMEKYKGKLDLELAKKLIADHYDVYLKKTNPCSRTVCSHYELDGREYMSQADRPKPYAPHGTVDGFVCTSNLAQEMSFYGRWGSSCGMSFDKNKFCREHIQYSNYCPFLKDRPSESWCQFKAIHFNKNIINSYLKQMHTFNIKGLKKVYHTSINYFDKNNKIETYYYTFENINYKENKNNLFNYKKIILLNKHNKTKHNKTKHNKTKHNKTKHNKTKHNKTKN